MRVTAGLLGMAGRFDEAHELVDTRGRALRGARDPAGRRGDECRGSAEMLRLEGRLEDAERHFREMHEAYEEIGRRGSTRRSARSSR